MESHLVPSDRSPTGEQFVTELAEAPEFARSGYASDPSFRKHAAARRML